MANLKDRCYNNMPQAAEAAIIYAGQGATAYVFGTCNGYCVSVQKPPRQNHFRLAPHTTKPEVIKYH